MQPKDSQPAPQNVEAEASLLGAILIDADAIVKIADAISAEDFYDARHKHIYDAVVSLYEHGWGPELSDGTNEFCAYRRTRRTIR
jgi:replicative DNA helicase